MLHLLWSWGQPAVNGIGTVGSDYGQLVMLCMRMVAVYAFVSVLLLFDTAVSI